MCACLRRPWACVLFLSFAVAPAVAVEIDRDASLTLRDALSRVGEFNPDIKASAFELPALDGRREQAGLHPNPAISLEVENVAGIGAYEGAESAEITLALSQLIELGGKRGLRVGIVDATYSVAESELAVRRLDVASEVLRRFVQVAREQEHVALSDHRSKLAERTLAAVETRVNAARSPLAELHRAKAARNQASLNRDNAERQLRASLYRLAALWGESEPSFRSVKAELYSLPPISNLEDLLRRLEESPDVARLLTEARLRDAELRLAEARRRPDLTVSGGIRRLEQTNDMALVFSVQLPLAINDRNQGAIREARVRREQVDAQYAALLNTARADLFGFHQGLLQARAEIEALRGQVLPELEDALRQTELAYERGRYSYLELVDAQRSVIEVRSTLIDAAARYHSVLAEIERLTGQAFALPAY